MNRTQGLALAAVAVTAIVTHGCVRITEIVETERTKRHRASLRWGWLGKGIPPLGRLLSTWWSS